MATPSVLVQENFSEYDVPWRKDLVCGWDPIRRGEFAPIDGRLSAAITIVGVVLGFALIVLILADP